MTWESLQLPLAQLKLASESNLSQDHSCRIGWRFCLDERCERIFQPNHHLDRYCGPECLASARRWQLRFANQNYRRSTNGKLRRKEQSLRYRLHAKERKALEIAPQTLPDPPRTASAKDQNPSENQPREGYTKDTAHEKCACHRPGCYRRFTPPPQSPLKKFCSARCRNALRRVILRERKWLARLNPTKEHARDGPQTMAS